MTITNAYVNQLTPAPTPLAGSSLVVVTTDGENLLQTTLAHYFDPLLILSRNGFTGSVSVVSNSPMITIGTSVTGVTKGLNGALTQAVAGVDYVVPSGSVAFASNLIGGAALQVPYQTATNTTAFVAAPTVTNSFLSYDGTQLTWTVGGPGGSYFAGTGLTLTGSTFSITNTGVNAGSYGSASSTVTLAINAQGQITSASAQDIAISASQITSGVVSVSQGGTGSSSLTGYVKGAGTSALTAVSQIPYTDVSGLGTMATQNAGSLDITGGTINGTSIGVTTTAAGYFTTLNATGGLSGGAF
jgi:hypothetical protein